MSGLCVLALVSGLTWSLPDSRFTLAWIHSVERVEWRETWAVETGQLRLLEARVHGSGAGMEPGPGAHWENGWWVWQPRPPLEVPSLELVRSGVVADYELCLTGTCRPLGVWLPGILPTENVQLSSC